MYIIVNPQAVRTSMYGRPGPSYLEVPGNMVNDKVSSSKIRCIFVVASQVGAACPTGLIYSYFAISFLFVRLSQPTAHARVHRKDLLPRSS